MSSAEEQASQASGSANAQPKPVYRNQFVCEVEDQSNFRTYGVTILIFILAGFVIYLAINLCKPLVGK